MTTDDLSRAAQRTREVLPPAIGYLVYEWLNRLSGQTTFAPGVLEQAQELAREVLSLPSAPDRPDRDELARLIDDELNAVDNANSAPDATDEDLRTEGEIAADVLLARGLVRTPTADHPADVIEGSGQQGEAKRMDQMISLRLDAALVVQLKERAAERDMTVSDLLREVIAEHLAVRTPTAEQPANDHANEELPVDPAERLRLAAAGRREYAKGCPDDEAQQMLEAEARCYDNAARIVADDISLQLSIPAWMPLDAGKAAGLSVEGGGQGE